MHAHISISLSLSLYIYIYIYTYIHTYIHTYNRTSSAGGRLRERSRPPRGTQTLKTFESVTYLKV